MSGRNILIIKPSSIGDVVHTLPIWNLLRLHYPDARISWLIAPACSGIVQGLPGLELLRFDRAEWGRAWRSVAAARSLMEFHRRIRRERFDLVLDVQGLFRSGWFAWVSGAKQRVGFANAREMAWAFYTHRVEVGDIEQHAVERYRKLLEAIGCPSSPIQFPFPVTQADREAAEEMTRGSGPFAVLCPGANWLSKRWPTSHFAGLVEPLRSRHGLACVVAGGPGDRGLGEQIPGAVNLCGRTTLMQLVALMERAALVVSNDSGPMHIAAALDRPLVSIFGPTNPVRTGPYGHEEGVVRLALECMPCYQRQCPYKHHRCLEALEVERVLEAIARQLGKA